MGGSNAPASKGRVDGVLVDEGIPVGVAYVLWYRFEGFMTGSYLMDYRLILTT